MASLLPLLPAVLLPVVTAGGLALAALAPREDRPMLARFADDRAALAGALAAGAMPIALPGGGRVLVAPAPGLVAALLAAGAVRVTGFPTALGCAPDPQGLPR